MTMPALAVAGLQKSFGPVQVLHDITLDIHAGKRHLVLGANGAGKTTFFNMLTGQLAPSAGRIMFYGEDITALSVERRARLGLGRTFQIASVFGDLTVRQNLALAMTAPCVATEARKESPDSIVEAISRAGLASHGDRPAKHLSYGQQRRLEVEMAFVSKPRMLLLDEPMAGLTRDERHDLAARIVDLGRTTGILLIEHDMEVALAIAERLTVLHLGRVLADGSVEEVLSNRQVQDIYLGRGHG